MIAVQKSGTRVNEHRAGSKHFPLFRVGECLYRSEGNIYFAVVKSHGRQYRRSMKTKDREIAQRKLAKYREQLRRLDPRSAQKRWNPTFLDVGEPYLNSIRPHISGSTFIRRESVIRRMRRWFSQKAIRDISRLDCERWATDRWKQQVSSRTFNHELETVKLVFNYAIEHGWLLDSPATGLKRLKQEKPLVLIPSREQFVTLVNDMRSRTSQASDWLEFLAYSGCRTGEASEVRWEDVDYVQRAVRITGGEKGTKNGEGRSIPLFPALEHLLERMKSALPAPPQPTDRILREINARWALATVCKRLNLPSFHRHSFRHFFASNAIEAGCDFKVIAGWLGHKDGGVLVATTYGHLRAEHSNEMAKKMTFEADVTGVVPIPVVAKKRRAKRRWVKGDAGLAR